MGTGEIAVIKGIIVEPLKQFCDDRGKVMHMLRSDSRLYSKFGEIYFSVVNSEVVKAWKKHKSMAQHFAVPVGKIRLVIYDDREKSTTQKNIDVLEIGGDNYCLVKIPPLLWYGFKGISKAPSLIANCTDIPYNPAEIERIGSGDSRIPYKW